MNRGNRKQPEPSGFTDAQERWITSQLVDMKRQIDAELTADISTLRDQLVTLINAQISKSEATVASLATDLKQMDTKITATNSQIVVANKQQLVAVRESTKELINAVGQQITNSTYKKVVEEINKTIVPKVENMMQYVSYQMQDGGEIVTDYRRAVDRVANNTGSKMLTDGKDKHIISENVSMFFREGD